MDFDPAVLAQLKADLDAETVKEILTSYLSEAPDLLAQARSSLGAKDLATFQRAVHTLKSTSANVGATLLSEAAKALEVLARQGQLPRDARAVDELGVLFEAVAPRLRAWNG